MSDDIAFKIQLGLFLPKLESTVQESLSKIIEEHMTLLRSGTLEGEEAVTIEGVKEVVMKNLEIFLDSKILPGIAKKFYPVEEVKEGEGEGETKAAA